MTELAGQPACAVQRLTLRDHATADTGRDRDVDEVGAPPPGAERRLTEGGDIGVPIEHGGKTQTLLHLTSEGDPAEGRPEVRRFQDDPAPRVHRTRRADPDAGIAPGKLRRCHVASGAEESDTGVDDGAGSLVRRGFGRDAGGARAVRQDHSGTDLGPAQVKCEDRSLRQGETSGWIQGEAAPF